MNALSYPVPADDVVTEAPTAHVDPNAAEHNRWMLGMGVPLLGTSLCIAAALGTGHAWLMAPAILFLGIAIVVLPWLAMSSCTLEQS